MEDKKGKWITVELYTSFLYDGMILNGELLTEDGEKVASAKEIITAKLIEDLKAKNIKKLFYIKPSRKKEVKKEASPKEEKVEEAFVLSQEIAFRVERKASLPVKEIESTVEDLINEISNSKPETVLNLIELKEYDEYTYTHSVNVSLISISFARILNWEYERLKNLGIGAMLHDIGKLLLPKEIINKNDKLTKEEYEIVKKHTIYGYEIVKAQPEFNDTVQKIPLLHHECYNGTGYPFGLSGEKLDETSQIVSMADVFDATISKRSYKEGYPMWNAFLYIHKNAGTKFIPRLAIEFVNKMPSVIAGEPVLKVGDFVVLNTKEIGEIIELSDKSTLKPVVNIYLNSKQQKVKFPIRVMLEVDVTRWIETIIEDEKLIETLRRIKSEFVKKEEKK